MGQRVVRSSEVNLDEGAGAKASLIRARELLRADPKPGELVLDRLKAG